MVAVDGVVGCQDISHESMVIPDRKLVEHLVMWII